MGAGTEPGAGWVGSPDAGDGDGSRDSGRGGAPAPEVGCIGQSIHEGAGQGNAERGERPPAGALGDQGGRPRRQPHEAGQGVVGQAERGRRHGGRRGVEGDERGRRGARVHEAGDEGARGGRGAGGSQVEPAEIKEPGGGGAGQGR